MYASRSGHVRFLRAQGWHKAASVSTWPELILRKPRAQYWAAQWTSGQPTALASIYPGPPLHWEAESRLPQLRQVLHQGDSETSALRKSICLGTRQRTVEERKVQSPARKPRAQACPSCLRGGPEGPAPGSTYHRCPQEQRDQGHGRGVATASRL